ncbi:MAG: hypothetical protein ACREHG_10690, partial [Candidatus Saccharimonadales bacterium]
VLVVAIVVLVPPRWLASPAGSADTQPSATRELNEGLQDVLRERISWLESEKQSRISDGQEAGRCDEKIRTLKCLLDSLQ